MTAPSQLRPPADPPLAGVRAGGYTLERELGRGGMAAVYLAHDPKHDRRVAVKVLAAELTALLGAERFVQEVRVTARLQHPHILGLLDSGVFGPEAGAFAGRPYYVMPYVAGPSLRTRLDREGALPVAEALRLAQEVASALDSAHRHGVVHRDVKPENVLLDEDGAALVADFGIAVALEQAGGTRLTQTGLSLGTPAYMAPEQAMGERQITPRADVYALGAVLYELLAGEPPFTGPTAQAVVARVMTETPRSLTAQRPSVPPAVDAAVRTALEKLPADRFESARAFADALTDALRSPPGTSAVRDARPYAAAAVRPEWRARVREPLLVAALLLGALGGGAAAAWWAHGRAAPAARPVRFALDEVRDATLGGAPALAALAPDGRTVVIPGAGEGGTLRVRPLDDLRGRSLAGTAGARNPFFSPDGRRVAFVTADDKLATVALDEGAAPTVVGPLVRFAEGCWAPGGAFVVGHFRRGLTRIDARTGAERPLTAPDTGRGEDSHGAPRLLPDGRAVVFTIATIARRGAGSGGALTASRELAGELAVVPLDGPAAGPTPYARLGLTGRGAVGVVDGWLVYIAADGSGLMAAPFDYAARRVTGPPAWVLRDPDGGIVAAALAADGTLLYTRGASASHRLALVDARGNARPLTAALGADAMWPRLSPDGRRLAFAARAADATAVWIYDLASGTPTRLSTGRPAFAPEWTPDGRRLVFISPEGGRPAIWSQPADGSAPPERLVAVAAVGAPVTPDGRTLVFQRPAGGPATGSIWSVRLDGDRTPHPVLAESDNGRMPAVSPDGRWLAYAASESGREEVHVQPFPGPGAAVQVSVDGGTEPVWARDGRRLFYRTGRELVAASVRPARGGGTGTLVVTARDALFRDSFEGGMPHVNYAVTPDGQHFVMFGADTGQRLETVVVVHWRDELRAALEAGHVAAAR